MYHVCSGDQKQSAPVGGELRTAMGDRRLDSRQRIIESGSTACKRSPNNCTRYRSRLASPREGGRRRVGVEGVGECRAIQANQ